MNRSVVIDTLKAVASQVIVLHHLTLYAPMTEWLAKAWPNLIAFFYDDGRLAVQPFLVMGGFLTAQSLSKTREQPVGTLLWKRYWRLAPPLGLALLLVVVATVLLGNELSHEDWLSPLPTLGDFLAHLFFLQDILEIPSLSAGAWRAACSWSLNRPRRWANASIRLATISAFLFAS